jgi:hypothetical protein
MWPPPAARRQPGRGPLPPRRSAPSTAQPQKVGKRQQESNQKAFAWPPTPISRSVNARYDALSHAAGSPRQGCLKGF